MTRYALASLAFGLLPVLAVGEITVTPGCAERIERQVAPVLTGHIHRVLPCDFMIRFSLSEAGEAENVTAHANESICERIRDRILEAFAQYEFAPGERLEGCVVSMKLRYDFEESD
jgi:hypothetical protein